MQEKKDGINQNWNQNAEGIKLCEKCSTPITDTGNSKKLCSNCALENIRKSKKRNKNKVLNIAS